MKRVTISIRDDQAETLTEIGKLAGISVSSLVRDLITTSEPMFKELIEHLEVAKQSQEKAEKAKANYIKSVQETMKKGIMGVEDQIDLLGENSNGKKRKAKR